MLLFKLKYFETTKSKYFRFNLEIEGESESTSSLIIISLHKTDLSNIYWGSLHSEVLHLQERSVTMWPFNYFGIRQNGLVCDLFFKTLTSSEVKEKENPVAYKVFTVFRQSMDLY